MVGLLAGAVDYEAWDASVIQPSSVPVDRRMRSAKSDGIDAELLLPTLLAWLRGEPRVCPFQRWTAGLKGFDGPLSGTGKIPNPAQSTPRCRQALSAASELLYDQSP
jgi:hypothetical protein